MEVATTLSKEYAERLMEGAKEDRYGPLPPGYHWTWCPECKSKTPQNYGICYAHERPPTLDERRESHPVTLLGNAGLLGRKKRARFPDPSKEEMLATIREMGLVPMGKCYVDQDAEYGADAPSCKDRRPATPTCGGCRHWTFTGDCE